MSGKIVITLDDFRKSKGVSKYKICRACNLQQTQLNAYCNNKMSRIDLDVLTRICDFLECDLTDIVKYYPLKKEKTKTNADIYWSAGCVPGRPVILFVHAPFPLIRISKPCKLRL